MSLSCTSHASPRRFFGDEWAFASTRLPEPRCSCAYTSLGEDRHLLIGGKRQNQWTVTEYNSTMKLFSSHTPLPEGSYHYPAAVSIGDERLLVVGGYYPCCVTTQELGSGQLDQK